MPFLLVAQDGLAQNEHHEFESISILYLKIHGFETVRCGAVFHLDSRRITDFIHYCNHFTYSYVIFEHHLIRCKELQHRLSLITGPHTIRKSTSDLRYAHMHILIRLIATACYQCRFHLALYYIIALLVSDHVQTCLLPLIAQGNFTMPSSYPIIYCKHLALAYATYALELALSLAFTFALLQSYYQNQNQNCFQHQHMQHIHTGPGGVDGEAVWFKRSMKYVTHTACLVSATSTLQFFFYVV